MSKQILKPIEILTPQALPAAGAFLTSDEVFVGGARFVSLGVQYTRGAVGGLPRLEPDWLNEELATFEQATDQSGTDISLQFRDGPIPSGAGAIRYVVQIVNPGRSVLRIRAQESPNGQQGSPGSIGLSVGALE